MEIASDGWLLHYLPDEENLQEMHVTPVKDLKPHILAGDCDCMPTLDPECGLPMWIHNSYDRRELEED